MGCKPALNLAHNGTIAPKELQKRFERYLHLRPNGISKLDYVTQCCYDIKLLKAV